MADIGTILETLLLGVKDLDAVFVSGNDGFIIEGKTKEESIDLDSVAGLVMPYLVDLAEISKAMDYGQIGMAMVEFELGVVISEPVNQDALLVLLARDSKSLGNIRIKAKQAARELAAEF